ncbi:hypothetical protein D3C85_1203060 [compost metagenome]
MVSKIYIYLVWIMVTGREGIIILNLVHIIIIMLKPRLLERKLMVIARERVKGTLVV